MKEYKNIKKKNDGPVAFWIFATVFHFFFELSSIRANCSICFGDRIFLFFLFLFTAFYTHLFIFLSRLSSDYLYFSTSSSPLLKLKRRKHSKYFHEFILSWCFSYKSTEFCSVFPNYAFIVVCIMLYNYETIFCEWDLK